MKETLVEILADITDVSTMDKLLNEILTPGERKTVEMRIELMKDLRDGIPQRDIASNHNISLCKITRGSKILKDNDSVIAKILKAK
jgi:TrpR family transcriptional regulator, trp operon repressor